MIRTESVPVEYDAFAAEMWPKLTRAAMLMGADRVGAEDLAQEVLIKCYTSWWRVAAAATPESYALKILRNTLVSHHRRRSSTEIPVADPTPKHSTTPGDAEGALALRQALLRLPYDQRIMLVLRYYLDVSETRAAEILEVPLGTVKSRTHRAVARLAELLDEDFKPHREVSP